MYFQPNKRCYQFKNYITLKLKAVANSPVGQVLTGPLFLKVITKLHFTKASNKQKYLGDSQTGLACYITQIEKIWDEL